MNNNCRTGGGGLTHAKYAAKNQTFTISNISLNSDPILQYIIYYANIAPLNIISTDY
jgi:hypothetical protein